MTLPLPARLSAFFGKRSVRRSLLALASLLVLYALLGFLVLPAVVKSQLENFAAEKLQRALSIGKVDINPFSLRMTLSDVKLNERDSDAVFASFDTLTANLSTESLFRLAPVVQQVYLARPYVHLVHKDAHAYNVDDIIRMLADQPPSEEPSRFSAYNIQVEDGRIDFEDKPASARHVVSELKLGIPFISSLPSQVDIFVEPLLSANVNGAPLSVQGKARPFANPADAVVSFDLRDLDITRYLGYLPFRPNVKVPSARLDLQLTASFQQPKDKAPALLLDGNAKLKSLKLVAGDRKPLLDVQELSIELHKTSVFGDRFDIARVRLTGAQADLARESDGTLNVQHLIRDSAPTAAPARQHKPSAGRRIAVGALEIRNTGLRFTDAYAAHPMQAGVDKLDLDAHKLAIDTGKKTVSVGALDSGNANLLVRENIPPAKDAASAQRPVAKAEKKNGDDGAPYLATLDRISVRGWSARIEDHSQPEPAATVISPMSFTLEGLSTAPATSARVAMQATVNKSGQVGLQGSFSLAPFQTELALNARNVDILPLQPYIADRINLRLTRASLTGDGKLQLRTAADGSLQGGYKGNVTLGNLATVDRVSGSDFVRWKSLHAGGVDLQLAPFALAMEELALSDFFARVIINPQGRINLQDVLRDDGDDHRSLTEEKAARSDKPASARATASAAPATEAKATGQETKMPPIAIRKLTLQGGRVRFTDNFIRPNYSATLADFGGVVNGLSSDPASKAALDMHGIVNGAPLVATGSINPLRGNLFLDLKANVRGMELAPLSAYSGRYIGYGIEKGKLSFEVAYRVDNRQLTAENRLILDQLTFGEEAANTTAEKLPVHFAVALLRDRNGVIDINLPVAGSLDDPEFSVGGIIVRLIVNAIAKAVTQPFALLGALFGGGSAELSSMELAPGRAAIPPAGEEKLRTLAKALTERPALKLDVTGRIDPEADRAGLKRVSVERKVRMLKINDLRARGETPQPGSVVVGREEYPELLRRAYRDEKFPKPRNVLGLPKDLPVEEMEKLMMDNAEIDEDDLIALGNQRAQQVKNWLQKNGQVSPDRVFILAPKQASAETRGKENLAAHRVDFSLR
ncbi:MAG TPA: DUF748 domain-containing protein [Noviherbaspirillum sp.]